MQLVNRIRGRFDSTVTGNLDAHEKPQSRRKKTLSSGMSRRVVLPRSNSHVGEFQSRDGSFHVLAGRPSMPAARQNNRVVMSEYHLKSTLATSTLIVLVCRPPRGEDRKNRFVHWGFFRVWPIFWRSRNLSRLFPHMRQKWKDPRAFP